MAAWCTEVCWVLAERHELLICNRFLCSVPHHRCDKDIKVSYTVYNRLSVLLKSLLAITRVTPAYKLSRKQGHDYVILYRQVDISCLIM